MTKYSRRCNDSALIEAQDNTRREMSQSSSTSTHIENNRLPTDNKNSDPSEQHRLELIVNSNRNLVEINREFEKIRTHSFICHLTKTGVKVKFSTEEDLTKHQSLLAKHKISSTVTRKTNSAMIKIAKYVIKGLSHHTYTTDIHDELQTHEFNVISIQNMISWTSKKPLPIFQLAIDTTDIRKILHHKIKIEPLKRKQTPPQCSNCQMYKHAAGRCKSQPKCRYCAGNHKTIN